MSRLTKRGEKGNLDIESFDIDSLLRELSTDFQTEGQIPQVGQQPPVTPPEAPVPQRLTAPGDPGRLNIGEFDEESLLSDILPGFKEELPADYYQTPQERESFLQTAGRTIAGAGQSIASVLAGLPGSILSLPGNIAETLAEKIGFPLREPEKFESEKWGIPREKYLETLEQYKKAQPPGLPGIKETLLDVGLPTVPGVKKGIAEVGKTVFGISPEFWDPKTATEKSGREYIERVTGLLHPGLWPLSLGKAFMAPIVGWGGEKAAKALGLGDFWQKVVGGVGEVAFIGWSPKRFKERMDSAFDKARSFLRDPKQIVTAINPAPLVNLSGNIKKFVRNIQDPTKAEQWMIDRANGLLDAIEGKKIEVEKLWELKKSFGKHASEFKGPFKNISRFVKKTNDTFDEMIRGYGKKYNPKFLKAYSEANDAFQGFQKMPKYLKTINNAIEKRSDLITLGIAGGVLSFGSLGKALVGLKLAKNTVEAYNLLKNSPAIRNFYVKGVAAAAKQNVKGATRYFEKADEALEKKFPGITAKAMQQQRS